MPALKIAPSILSADFGDLYAEIKTIECAVDLIHVDVMDGHFVPNLTIGAPVVAWLKSKRPLDCHLMIEHPERFIDDFANAGAAMVTVHEETCRNNLPRVLRQIKRAGMKAAVAMNPETPIQKVFPVLDTVSMVLLMTVHPGFGGQKFITSVVPKIRRLRSMKPNLDIEVDGGINGQTAKIVKAAGANVLVAGHFIFRSKNRLKAIAALRNA